MIIQALDLSAKTGAYIGWAIENREYIEALPTEAADLMVALIDSGGDAIQRVGSQLVFGSPDGAQSVVGFIDQTIPQLNQIETAVTGLEVGQTALSSSLVSLQTVSMVTLGVSAIAPVLLVSQFRYLSGQFNQIKKSLVDLKQMQYDKVKSTLDSGLCALETGVEKENPALIEDALRPCSEALSFFEGQLAKALESQASSPQFLNYIARHLGASMCATARTHIGMGYDDKAHEVLDKHQPLLNQTSSRIFAQTVGNDPTKFLLPEMADVVSFEFVRSLYRQANAAEIWPMEDSEASPFPESNLGPQVFFESIRPALFRSRKLGWNRKAKIKFLLSQIHLAVANLEETNRVASLLVFLKQAKEKGVATKEVMAELNDRKQDIDAPFVAWNF